MKSSQVSANNQLTQQMLGRAIRPRLNALTIPNKELYNSLFLKPERYFHNAIVETKNCVAARINRGSNVHAKICQAIVGSDSDLWQKTVQKKYRSIDEPFEPSW
jgi:hypothetical protein